MVAEGVVFDSSPVRFNGERGCDLSLKHFSGPMRLDTLSGHASMC